MRSVGSIWTVLALGALLGTGVASAQATNLELAGSSRNPRWLFKQGSNKAIVLTGSHTWSNLQSYPNESFNYGGNGGYLKKRMKGHNFMRGWLWEDDNYMPARYNTVQTNPTTIYNLDSVNEGALVSGGQIYDRLAAAASEDIWASVMLFQGWSTGRWPGNRNDSPWSHHPFAQGRNQFVRGGVTKSLNGDYDPGFILGTEIHRLNTSDSDGFDVLDRQLYYVDRVVNRLKLLNNVIFEVGNETWYDPAAVSWMTQIVSRIKSASGGNKLVMASCQNTGGGLPGQSPSLKPSMQELVATGADLIAPCADGPTKLYIAQRNGSDCNASASLGDPPHATGQRVLVADSDHIGVLEAKYDLLWPWKFFLRGYHPIFMDLEYDLPWKAGFCNWFPGTGTYDDTRDSMRGIERLSRKVKLKKMVPQRKATSYPVTVNGTSSPFVLYSSRKFKEIDPDPAKATSKEYLVWNPGDKKVTFQQLDCRFKYDASWFDPLTGVQDGETQQKRTGSCPSGQKTAKFFINPSSEDRVLRVRRAGRLPDKTDPAPGSSTVTFSYSLPPDPDEETYQWILWDGSTLTGQTFTHDFSGMAPGEYTVTLRTFETGYDPVDETVTHRVNAPPVAACTLEPGNLVELGEVTIFDAVGSYDPDGDVASYSWDYDCGHGSSEPRWGHHYHATGTYQPTVTVTDNDGASASATCPVTVGVAPVASIATVPSPADVAVGETVTFDGRGSTDADGTIVSYSWSFGDGATSGASLVNHAYVGANSYSASLTVTDSHGFQHTRWVPVFVGAPPTITSQPQSDVVPLGRPVTLSVGATGDGTLAYRWQKVDGAAVNLSDGGGITGATSPTLQIETFDLSRQGGYRCIVSSEYGQRISQTATLDMAAISTFVRDSFRGAVAGTPLAGRAAEVGEVTWQDSHSRMVISPDGGATPATNQWNAWASVPFAADQIGMLTRISADTTLPNAGWSGISLLRQAGHYNSGYDNAQVWLRINASGQYFVDAQGTSERLKSGTLAEVGNCTTCRLEMEYDPLDKSVRAWISGFEVLGETILPAGADVAHAGLQIAASTSGPAPVTVIDDFQVAVVPAPLRDGFSGPQGQALGGEPSEVGGLPWVVSPAQRLETDGNGGLALSPSYSWGQATLPYDPDRLGLVARISATLEPRTNGWTAIGFLDRAGGTLGGSPPNAQIWLLLRVDGYYYVRTNFTADPPLVSGYTSQLGGCEACAVELEYDPLANSVRAWIEGTEVLAETSLPFTPDVEHVGLYITRSGGSTVAPESRIHDFQLSLKPSLFPPTIARDTFSSGAGGDTLAGRTTEVGGFAWDDPFARLMRGAEGAARLPDDQWHGYAAVPFDPSELGLVTRVSADIEPRDSGWAGLGLLRQPGSYYPDNGQLMLRLFSSGYYTVHAFDVQNVLASGYVSDLGGCARCRVELEYDPLTNTARTWIAGHEILAATDLGSPADIGYAGIQIFAATSQPHPESLIDSFELSVVPSPLRDTFSGADSGAPLDGRLDEVSGLAWQAAGMLQDPQGAWVDYPWANGFGSLPFAPADLGVPTRVGADLERLGGSGWAGLLLLAGAGSCCGSPPNAQIWFYTHFGGTYAVRANGTTGAWLASGSLSEVGGCVRCRAELEYDPLENTLQAWLQGVEVLPRTPLPFTPDIRRVGIQMVGYGETPLSLIDDLEVSTGGHSGVRPPVAEASQGTAPAITSQPVSLVRATGSSAGFSCAATGSSPLRLRWQKDGVDLSDGGRIAGALTANLTISNLAIGDSGDYTCTATNSHGEAVSNAANLDVGVAPSITAHPAPVTAVPGATATFSCAATGDGSLWYRWRKDGVVLSNGGRISGATTTTLTITNLQTSDSGHYTCRANNPYGVAFSNAAQLTVGSPPTITSHPAPVTTFGGAEIGFGCLASSTLPIQYQWRKNGAPLADDGRITGANSQMVTIRRVQASDAAQYTCVASNTHGATTSNAATLTFQGWRVYPIATTHSEGFWPTPVHEQINDGSNVVTSGAAGDWGDQFTVRMAPMADPQTDLGHIIYVWARALDNSPVTIRVLLYQGSTQLAWRDHTHSSTMGYVGFPIPAEAAANITDYSDVRVAIHKFHEAWNSSNRRVEIQRIEFRVPANPVAPQVELPVATTMNEGFSPGPIHAQLDDDVNVVTSTMAHGWGDQFIVRMGAASDPGVHSGHVIRVTANALDLEPVTVRVVLLQGATQLGWWDREFTLAGNVARIAVPSSAAAQITNYGDVRINIQKFHEAWNSSNRRARIRKIEWEVP